MATGPTSSCPVYATRPSTGRPQNKTFEYHQEIPAGRPMAGTAEMCTGEQLRTPPACEAASNGQTV